MKEIQTLLMLGAGFGDIQTNKTKPQSFCSINNMTMDAATMVPLSLVKYVHCKQFLVEPPYCFIQKKIEVVISI
jgi:hypothetical protein